MATPIPLPSPTPPAGGEGNRPEAGKSLGFKRGNAGSRPAPATMEPSATRQRSAMEQRLSGPGA